MFVRVEPRREGFPRVWIRGRPVGVLVHVLGVVMFTAMFAGAGVELWRRSNAADLLASRRARLRALALGGFGFASLISAGGLGTSETFLGVLGAVWLVAVVACFGWQFAAEMTERREAHQRNAALGWPRGKPPPHPGWGLVAAFAWTTTVYGIRQDPDPYTESWPAVLAMSAFGISEPTAAAASSWLYGIVLVLIFGWTTWSAVRRLLWWARSD